MADDVRPRYEPPTGDEPLDAIEQALVRALVPILVEKIRAARTAERQDDAGAAPIALRPDA